MSMFDIVNDTIEHMTWLTASDEATVALARTYAVEIDKAQELYDAVEKLNPELLNNSERNRLRQLEIAADVTKTVATLGPRLMDALKELGGTPSARRALGAEEEVRGRLADLRAAR